MKSRVFGCPSCQQPFQVLAEQAGQIVQCPSCAQSVEIPVSAFTSQTVADSAEATATATHKHKPTGPELVSKCDNCQGRFGITTEMFGTQVACPHCQQAVEIKDPEADVPEINIDTTKQTGKSSTTNQYLIRKKDQSPAGPGSPTQTPGQAPAAGTSDKQLTDGLLPPTVARTDSNKSNTDKKLPSKEVKRLKEEETSPTKPAKNHQAAKSQPDPITHLLPPRFDVADPTRIRVSGSAPDHKILLLDGAGGLKQVDERIVQIEHDGQKISLVALTPQQRMRRRLITNAIAILLGIAILAIAFSFLT